MRLDVLDHGHRRHLRASFWLVHRGSGSEMADVPKTLLYRPEFFGAAMIAVAAPAMRGPSFWTPAEREYLATFIARLHRCPYCVETHTELVRIATTGEIDPGDQDTARPELAALLPFVEAVSRFPDRVDETLLTPVREAAVPERAVVDALRVSLVWNTINRLANAFGFRLRDGQLRAGTRALHRLGYRFPRVLIGTPAVGTVDASAVRAMHGESLVASLRANVFEAPGHTDPGTRLAAGLGGDLPEPLGSYAAKVRDASHRVSDADTAALAAAGYSQDAIFEITIASAVGAALRSFDAGMTCVEQRRPAPN